MSYTNSSFALKTGYSGTQSPILKTARRLCNLIVGCRWHGSGKVWLDSGMSAIERQLATADFADEIRILSLQGA